MYDKVSCNNCSLIWCLNSVVLLIWRLVFMGLIGRLMVARDFGWICIVFFLSWPSIF